jgi:hypothetical protein
LPSDWGPGLRYAAFNICRNYDGNNSIFSGMALLTWASTFCKNAVERCTIVVS